MWGQYYYSNSSQISRQAVQKSYYTKGLYFLSFAEKLISPPRCVTNSDIWVFPLRYLINCYISLVGNKWDLSLYEVFSPWCSQFWIPRKHRPTTTSLPVLLLLICNHQSFLLLPTQTAVFWQLEPVVLARFWSEKQKKHRTGQDVQPLNIYQLYRTLKVISPTGSLYPMLCGEQGRCYH